MYPVQINFDKENYTLLLQIERGSFDISDFVRERARSLGLYEKDEHHITVFGFSVGKKIEDALRGRVGMLEDFIQLVENWQWEFTPKEEFYILNRSYKVKGIPEERTSIIAMVEVKNMNDFIHSVNDILKIDLDVPPTHITIYSKSSISENNQIGIGISSEKDLLGLDPKAIIPSYYKDRKYEKIALPTRPQPDTIVAIFILKKLGKKYLNGIENSDYTFISRLPEGKTSKDLFKEGVFLMDVGGGAFDHHGKSVPTTASNLVADFLDERDNPALSKLLKYAERDDFYGKGTISTDPLDRAFGLSGLITSLNKKFSSSPETVIELTQPLIEAFYEEEIKRAYEMPQELEEKLQNGRAQTFGVRQRDKNLKCIFIETNNISMAGFLRSKNGGAYDVVIIKLPTGHINILTRPQQKIDLRSLALILRVQEAEVKGKILNEEFSTLSVPGVIKDVPQWYYDPATNSLLNGGPNPGDVEPTSIPPMNLPSLIDAGLSEKLWAPNN